MSRVLTTLVSAAVLAACSHRGTAGGTGATPVMDPDAVQEKLIAHVRPAFVGGRIYGEVTFGPAQRAYKSRVTLSLTGAPTGYRLPWRIRTGRCDEAGPEDIGSAANYRTIDVRGDGSGQVTQDLDFLVPASRTYHVVVYASLLDRNNIVACGEIGPG